MMNSQYETLTSYYPSWMFMPEVKIKLYPRCINFPSSTWHYYKLFEAIGRIRIVDLTKLHTDKKYALVIFSPPPKIPFWEQDRIKIQIGVSEFIFEPEIDLSDTWHKFPIPISNVSVSIPLQLMSFGVMAEDNGFMGLATLKDSIDGPISLFLEKKLFRRNFILYFSINNERLNEETASHTQFKGVFDFDLVDQVFIEKGYPENMLLLILKYPPKFYVQIPSHEVQNTHSSNPLWNSMKMWRRITNLVSDPRAGLAHGPISLYEKFNCPYIDLGRWTVYKVLFDSREENKVLYDILLQVFEKYNVNIDSSCISTLEPQEIDCYSLIDLPSSVLGLCSNSKDLALETVSLTFPVRYQLEACLSQGIFNEYNLTMSFLKALRDLEPNDACSMLEKACTYGKRLFDLRSLFKISSVLNPINIPKYCHYSRTVVVTPTTMRLENPSVEVSNRVIRKFSSISDNFIRVKFTDERWVGRLHNLEGVDNKIYERIKRVLNKGIRIGNYHFEFFAWGSSQLREHGAYFFRSEAAVNLSYIRHWMGDFSSITNVAKFASRMSLSFSTTREFSDFKIKIREVPDVNRNGYCFTDGVGKMSRFLSQMIALKLGLSSPYSDPPSAIQFRLAGYKGVLAVSKESLPFSAVITRPSQKKYIFKDYCGIEISRFSSYTSSHLNRQIILVLSYLGIHDFVFINILRRILSKLEKALVDKFCALDLLTKHVDQNHITLELAAMIESGFMDSQEPFIINCLHLWRAWTLKRLKEKTQLPVENGALLLGCVDESGELRGHFENSFETWNSSAKCSISSLPQVFIQVGPPARKDSMSNFNVIEGPCIITRNPALHPGDIRVVNAVNIPELHHLKNVVVFPQNGDRDIPSMCSGGDLDGDEFLCIWDQSLMFKNWNVKPMDYSTPQLSNLGHSVDIEHLTNFFVEYTKNDNLSLIALAHLAHADKLGVGSQVCLKLAKLHSDAVDFAKTGVAAILPSDLLPKCWPHYMNRHGKTFHSNSVLGQLYDMIQTVDFKPITALKFNNLIGKTLKSKITDSCWDELLFKAQMHKRLYDDDLQKVKFQYNIETEFELWTTFIISHNNSEKEFTLHEKIGSAVFLIKEKYRKVIIDDIKLLHSVNTLVTLESYVIAMYEATRIEFEHFLQYNALERNDYALHGPCSNEFPLISFPWLFPDVLGKLISYTRKAEI